MKADYETLKDWKSGINVYDIMHEDQAVEFLYLNLKKHELIDYESVEEFRDNVRVCDEAHDYKYIIKRLFRLLRKECDVHGYFSLNKDQFESLFNMARGQQRYYIFEEKLHLTEDGVEWQYDDRKGISGEITKEHRPDRVYDDLYEKISAKWDKEKPWWRRMLG